MDGRSFITSSEKGWGLWHMDNVEYVSGGLSISQDRISTYVLKEPAASNVSFKVTISDIAVDACGILYIAPDAPGQVYFYDAAEGRIRPVFPESALPWKPGAICVSEDSIYILDTIEGTLLSISKSLFQERWRIKDDRFLGPHRRSMAMAEDGSVLILCKDSVAIVSPDGKAVNDVAKGLREPVDISAAKKSVFILDRGQGIISCAMDNTGSEVIVSSDKYKEAGMALSPEALTLDCMALGRGGEIFAGEAFSGEAGESFRSILRHVPGEGFVRIRPPVGSVKKLCMGREGDLFALSGDGKKVYVLERAKKNRLYGDTRAYEGFAIKAFDSVKESTEWHRLTLDAGAEEAGTHVKAYYFATDSEGVMPLRDDGRWREISGPTDGLIGPEGTGRYLWLMLRLIGTELDSPKVGSVRVYFPRSTYLRHLPAIYQENEAGRSFLERFLSVFESCFSAMEEDIEDIPAYLDPAGVPDGRVSWLGSLLAVSADETWSAAKKRRLIAMAPALYKSRGTKQCLYDILGVYIDDAPPEKKGRPATIIEHQQLDVIGDVHQKAAFQRLIGGPDCFSVLIDAGLSEEEIRTVKRIIDKEKPARTSCSVVELKPLFNIGGHTYLGINTALCEPGFIVDGSGLGRETFLKEAEHSGHIGLKSRLDMDNVLS